MRWANSCCARSRDRAGLSVPGALMAQGSLVCGALVRCMYHALVAGLYFEGCAALSACVGVLQRDAVGGHAGNHRRHTRTRNASLPTQANHTARGARKQPPNQGTIHAASEDTTHPSNHTACHPGIQTHAHSTAPTGSHAA